MIQRFLLLFLPVFFFTSSLFAQCAGSAITPWTDQFYCSNTNVTLTPTITNAPTGNPTYTWTYQGNPISPNPTGSSYTIPTNQSGTYAVTINYGPNCTFTDDVVVGFLSVPTIAPSQCITNGSTANLSVSFSPGLPTGITPTYSWTGPNGFTSSSATPSVSSFGPTKAGTYSVTVTFNPTTGPTCSYTLSTILYLTPSVPTFSIPANGCLGTNYSPTGFTTQPNTTYSWNVTPSSNSTGLNGSSPVFNFNNSGSYSVSVTATQNGCSATSSSQGISIINLTNNLPSVDGASSPQLINGINTFAICSGASTSTALVFNENLGGGNPNNPTNTLYIYTINGNVSSSFGSSIQVPINYGNNTFVSTASSGGCISTTTVNIYSGSNPYVSLGANNSINLCPGSIVNFVIDPTQSVGVTNPPGTTYTLTFSDVVGNTVYSDLVNDLTVPHTFNTTSCGVTNSGTTFPPNTYYALVTAQNPCGTSQSFYSPITVHNLPTADFTLSDSTLCAGQTTTLVNTGTAGSVVGNASPYNCTAQGKFFWQISGGVLGTNFTLGAGQQLGTLCSPSTTPPCSWNSTASNGSNTLDITFITSGYYTITQVFYNQCGQETFTRNICVINPPTCQFSASPNPGCSPLTVNINNTTIAPNCGGTPVPLTYAWTVTSPTGTTSSYTSNSSQVPPALTLTNPTATPQIFTITLVVSPKDPYAPSQNFGNPNCTSTCTQTVTVNPIPVFTPFNITSCTSPYQANVSLQASTNITSSFIWIASSNTNVNGESLTNQSSSNLNNILTNQSTNYEIINYSITPTSSLGCVGVTQPSTIILNAINPGTISSDQTICSGGNPLVLTGTSPNGFGTLSYQWQSSLDNINWTDITNAISASYDPPPTSSIIYYRRVVTYLSNGVSCSSFSNVVTITVNNISAGSIGLPQNICSGDDPIAISIINSPIGSGSLSYQWQSSTTSATSGFSNLNNQTSLIYDPSVLTNTTWYQLVVTSTLNGVTCSSNTPAVAVTIFTLNPGAIGSNQNICVDGDPELLIQTTAASTSAGTINYQWQSSNDNSNWTNIVGSTSSTFNPPILTTTTYYRRIALIYSGATLICQGYSNVVTITVIPDPTVTAPTSQSICTGGSPVAFTVSASGGINSNYSYQWYNASGAISSATSASYTPPSSAGDYYCIVSILPSTTGCSVNSTTATVSVVPDPTVSAPQSASYCQNASTVAALSVTANGGISTAYAYQWYSNAQNNTTTGTAITAANGGTLASYTPPVNSTGIIYYYCIVSINPASTTGCSVTSSIATITVNAGPSISTPPQSQSICVGGTLSDLTVAYSGGTGTVTYQWYSNTTNAASGGTAVGTSSSSYSLPTSLNSSAGTYYYYCQLSFGGSGGCSQVTTAVATINVVANPTVTAPTSQSICTGGSPVAMSVSASGGINSNYSYQWYNASGAISSATSASYTPPSSAGDYYCIVSILPSTTGCSVNSTTATVSVVPDPTVSAPQSASYCQNASTVAALSVTANGGISTAYAYQWYSNAQNNTTTGTAITAANGGTLASYTPPVNSTGIIYYYCIVSINPASTTGCSVTSAIATITVNAAPTFSTPPLTTQTVCLDGTFNALTVATQNGTGTPTFQWYSNTANSTTGGTSISGATNASYTPPATAVGTIYYYCVATFATGGCSNITSTIATAIVVADPVISLQPLPSQTICVDGNIATPLTASASGGTGTYSYQWSNATGAITGATNQNFTPPAFTTVGQYNYTVTITQSGSGCNPLTSQNAVIEVVLDPIVSTQPIGASYCQNASPVAPLSVTASGGTGTNYSYQWFNGTTQINGATSNTYNPSVASTGSIDYTCQITIAPLTSGCAVTSAIGTITVNLAPTFSTPPLTTQTVCLDGTFNALTVATQNGTGTPTFQWFSNISSSTSGGTPISGAIAASYTPPATAVGTIYYYCIATFATGGCSNITSTIATAIVVVDPVISAQPTATQSICVGGTIGSPITVNATGGTGTYSYQWSNAAGTITGATNQNFTPPAFTTVGQYNYTVTITQSGSGCNAMISQNALIDVVADPVVSTQPINAEYCQNASPVAPLTVSATGGLGTFSYQWYSNTTNNNTNGSLIPGATSSSFTPSVATVGTTYYYCIITQTGLNCGVTSNTGEIIVNLAPTFATPPLTTQTVCLDGTFNALTVATQNGTGTPTFQWFSNTTSSTSGGTAISGATTASYTPPGTAVGTIYYYCVATYATGGCSAITSTIATAVVVADPIISLQPIPTQSICVGGNIANALTVTATGGTGTTSYQWSTGTGPISGATNQSYNPPPFNTVGTYTYNVSVTLSGSGCNVITSQSAIVDVVADPIVSAQPISASYCQNGSPVTPLTVAATGGLGTFSYQWYSNTSNNNSGGALILGATSSSYTPSVATVGIKYYYCVITQSGLNCGVTSNTAGITVSLAPTFVLQPISQTICTGGAFAPLSVTYQDGTGVPSYQWFSNSTNNYSGAVAISGATNSTFQPSAASLGTTYYFCEISFSFGGCSSINSNISSQTVVADPIISVEPQATQSICVGGTIPTALNITVTGGTGAVTYQWFAGTNQVSGATQSTFLPSNFTSPGTFLFTANISISGVGCDALISQPAQIIVVDDPSVSQPLAAVYCQNASPISPLQVNVTGGLGTNAYQWYFSTANTTSSGTVIAGANSSSYVPSVATVGTAYYYCIVNQSAPNCATTSANAAIQVNLPPTISVQPLATQTLCEGGAPTILQVAYINGTNSATYQWYTNNSNSNIGGTPISNATTATYNPQSTILGTTYYYCVITFQQGGCSSLTTIAAQVTIVGDPAITTQPLANQEICQGNTITNALTFNYTGGTGTSTIAWYLDATPPVLINGVTTNSYLPIPFNIADTFSYFAELSFSGVGCNTISTQLAEIIVHPTPYATNLNDTLVVCNHSNLNIPLTATVTSTFNWQTQLTTAVNGESFLPQTSYSIDDSLSNTTTSPQFLTYTVTPTSFPYGCVGPDSTVVVQLQPDVILSMNPAMEICSGSPVNGILTSNIPSTFNWFVSIDNPNVTGESILPSTNWLINDVLVNSSTVNQVVIYSVFPVSIQGQCPGLAQPLVVTVKPPIDLLNPDTLTICSGQNVGINLVANTNVNFNWYASPSLNVTGETTSVVSSPLINDVLVNPTNAIEVVTYNVIGTSTANGCSSPVIPLYVVVNPIPSLVNLNPLTICNGNYLYPYSLQTSVIGATTNWSVLNNPIGIPSTFGSNTLPGFIATNNTIITQTGQILITPIYTNNNVTCIGNDTTLLIPVLPTPSVNPIADITACNLTQIPLTPVNGPVPNTVFEWYNANVSLGLNASGIGDIPTFVGLNNTTIPVSGTVTVAPSYTQNNITCQGNPIDFEITVNPSPTLLNSNIEICDGEFTNILLNANIPSTFQWNATIQANVYNETAAPVQNTAYINDQLVLATTTAQTVTYNVTPISAPYGCIGFDTTILVQVNPLPIVDFSVITPILCDQSLINFQNNSVGSLDFTWTFGDGDSSFLFNPVHEYANFGSYLVTLEAVDQLTGCFNDAAQTIIIHESPDADFIISDTLACGSLDVTFNALDLNPNWSYLWTFGDGTFSNQYGLAGHQYVTNGCFDINLQISTPEGCVSDTTQLDAVCIYPEPIAAFTMDDPVVSSLTPEVQFFNSSLFADSYLWEFGDGTTSQSENPNHLFPSDPATYVIVLTASNNVGCQDTAALSVTIWQDLAIYVPNTFTPNNDDDFNQNFFPVLTEGFDKEHYHLLIFDRWGELIFESFDYTIGWDGTYGPNGIQCQIGTYTWKILVDELQSGDTRKFLGHVNLIR